MSILPNNLSQVPAPDIIDQLSYEFILEEIKADIIAIEPALESVLNLESEPATKLSEAFAYRILLERSQTNHYALSLMLAYANGTQLDNLGALPFFNVQRHVLVEEDLNAVPPVEQVLEDDEVYRERIRLSLAGFSTAGPQNAYTYHALSAHSNIKDVAIDAPIFTRWSITPSAAAELPTDAIVTTCSYDANLTSPAPGDVAVTVLAYPVSSSDATTEKPARNGAANQEELDAVATALNADDIRPLTDLPRVRSAEIIEYALTAELYLYPRTDQASVFDAAHVSAKNYTNDRHRCGHDVTRSGIDHALNQPGVQRVVITEPDFSSSDSLIISPHQAAYCTAINISIAGVAV